MSKHILDRNRSKDSARARHFAGIERQSGAEGSHPSSRELHQREQTRSGTRVAQYLRIQRGRQA